MSIRPRIAVPIAKASPLPPRSRLDEVLRIGLSVGAPMREAQNPLRCNEQDPSKSPYFSYHTQAEKDKYNPKNCSRESLDAYYKLLDDLEELQAMADNALQNSSRCNGNVIDAGEYKRKVLEYLQAHIDWLQTYATGSKGVQNRIRGYQEKKARFTNTERIPAPAQWDTRDWTPEEAAKQNTRFGEEARNTMTSCKGGRRAGVLFAKH
jgi:hypothetical protein